MADWDVIIVGAGFGGLCTGALLANAGKKVLILEKDRIIGGRAKTILKDGQVIDDGAHIPSRAGHLEKIFADLGLDYPELIMVANSEIYYNGNWSAPRDLYEGDLFKKILTAMMAVPREELSRLDDVPLSQWVETVSDDPGVKDVLFFLACSTSVGNRLETYSAGDMIHIIREIFEAGLKLGDMAGVIKGGVKSVLDPLADFIRGKGGEIRLNVSVDSVNLKGGRATGVNIDKEPRLFKSQVLERETMEADYVILTAPLWDIFSLLDEDQFPAWWVDWVDHISTKVSQVWSNIYAVDEPFFDVSTFRWAPKMPHSDFAGVFIYMPSYGDAAGQHQFHALYQGHYDELPDLFSRHKVKVRRQMRELLDVLEQDTFEFFPQLKDNYHWKMPHVEIYGIAQSPGFTGDKKPSMQPPGTGNLYIVSYTVAEARGVGMQAVARGARMAAEAILGDK